MDCSSKMNNFNHNNNNFKYSKKINNLNEIKAEEIKLNSESDSENVVVLNDIKENKDDDKKFLFPP